MKYTREDFESDLENPEMLHIKDKERFISFYEELGRMEVQATQKYLPRMDFVKPVGKILELGCHAGFNLIHYAKLGYVVTGVEISSTLLDIARQKMEELQDNVRDQITLIHSDILDLNSIGKFDTIILTEVLEHVIDPMEILQKSTEYMKQSSLLYVSAPAKRIGNYSHVRGISRGWLYEAGQKCGIDFRFQSEVGLTKAIGKLK